MKPIMRRIIMTLCAAAAIVACSKTEVQYEAAGEIGFMPVKGNITKAAGLTGTLNSDHRLGIWAFWDADGVAEEPTTTGDVTIPITYTNYTDPYLVNALFSNVGSNNWGAPNGLSYPWPNNGALVFAGYTTPNGAVWPLDTADENDTDVSYTLGTDVMVFTNYDNTSEFDLCWFGRTAKSYNNRADGAAVGVTLNHALSWVSIAVYGEGSAVGSYTITSITLDQIPTKGTASCYGSNGNAKWDSVSDNTNVLAYSGEYLLDKATEDNGKKIGYKLTDNLVIPTIPVNLTISYKLKVNGVYKPESKTVSLKLNDGNTQKWESGIHYTYTLVIKANEIQVSPSYGAWGTADQSVTVE